MIKLHETISISITFASFTLTQISSSQQSRNYTTREDFQKFILEVLQNYPNIFSVEIPCEGPGTNASEPISAQCCISHRNQSFDLQDKLNDWFLYETQRRAETG